MIGKTPTVALKITDTAIKDAALDPKIRQLRDLKLPIYYRFKRNRDKGSWHLVRNINSKTVWRKLGDYPGLTSGALRKQLPKLLAQLIFDQEAEQLNIGVWSTMGELLNWYGERSATNSGLSARRKVTIKSVLKRHLMPLLEDVSIGKVNRQYLEDQLIWPLQMDYALSTVKLILDVMKSALKQATRAGHIDLNPLAGLSFSDFITAKIDPKECALIGEAGRSVIPALYHQSVEKQTLVLLMLLHATRISETRLSRWSDFDLVENTWCLPRATTKTKEHSLPLTELAVLVLKRYRHYQQSKGYSGVYLFPSNKVGHPLSTTSVNQWVQSISGSQWSSHDLRKLTRSNMLKLGISHWIGDRVLNHSQTKIDETYIFDIYQTLMREALTRYHQSLLPLGLSFFVTETIPRQDLHQNLPKASNHQ